MTKEQALLILKQPDRIGCNLIKANDEDSCKFNQESIEALDMAIKSMEKLEKIEQIVKSRGGFYLYDNLPPFQQIREVLEKE